MSWRILRPSSPGSRGSTDDSRLGDQRAQLESPRDTRTRPVRLGLAGRHRGQVRSAALHSASRSTGSSPITKASWWMWCSSSSPVPMAPSSTSVDIHTPRWPFATHFSAAPLPFVEVHLSNLFKREPMRHTSMTADLAIGVIAGFGARGYVLAPRSTHCGAPCPLTRVRRALQRCVRCLKRKASTPC